MIQIIYICCLLHNIYIEYLNFWELNDNDEINDDINNDFEYFEIENEGNFRRLELI